jgi:hypothetical protein
VKAPARVAALAVGTVVIALGACGEELPTEIGAGLLPDGGVRTVELILEPGRFLVADTSFSGFGAPAGVQFTVLANDFDGVLDANVLARFPMVPAAITVRDTAGSGTRPDTVPILDAGRLVVRIDTARSTPSTLGATLRLYRGVEWWDRETANWTLRVDSPAVQRPWAQPGGTRGALVAESVWAGGDSVIFNVDTLTLRAWADTADPGRGAILVSETPGSRVISPGIALQLDFRSTLHVDTVVTVTQDIGSRTFVFDPPPATSAGHARVGGVPGWRTFMELLPRLDTITVPCPGQPGCTMALRDASISRAALLLERAPSPPGYVLDDSLRIAAATVLVTEGVPLIRSPLGQTVGLSRQVERPAERTGTAEVVITELVRRLALAPEAGVARESPYVALLALTDGLTFGNAAFAPGARLRLILSVGQESQIR